MMAATWSDLDIDTRGRSSGRCKTRCPKCSPQRRHRNDPCLSVDLDRGLFKCHNCGWAGALGDPNGYGAPLGRREQTKVYRKPDPLPEQSDYPPGIVAFFRDRCIPLAVARRNRITATATQIAFPYFRGGELINVKYRSSSKKFRMEADAELTFYGLDDCAGQPQVVIVEGEMDKLAVEAAGVMACLSVPNGAQMNGSLGYLESGAAIFEAAHTIILATDDDEPGRWLEGELARRIGREKCYRVRWPEDCKDANDVLMRHGAETLRDCLADARPFPVAGIVTPEELRADYLALYRYGTARGASTGWPSLDRLYTVKPGQLTIVTGIPGSGKSEFLDALMVNLSLREDWSFAVYSPENFPPQRHLQKWAEKFTGKPFATGPTPRMSEDDALRALDWAEQHLAFLIPEEPTIDDLLDLARVQVFRFGTKGFVLDPWNEMDHSRAPNVTETEHISACLSRLRQFARSSDVHVWVLAHPRMLQKDKATGEYTVPTPYEISGSAHWFNKADNCLAVWRNKQDDTAPVEIYVQKIRFREIGQLGTAGLRYDKITGIYSDIGQCTPASAR